VFTHSPYLSRWPGSGAARPLLTVGLAMLITVSATGCAQDINRITKSLERGPSGTPVAAAAPTAVAAVQVNRDAKPVSVLGVADWDIPGGHFYTQTNGMPTLTSPTGYGVTNQDEAAFWSEYQHLGGPQTVGFPLSGRVTFQGKVTQVFQRAILQWNGQSKQVEPMNILLALEEAGKGQWLIDAHRVPPRLAADFDRGKNPDLVMRDRLDLLKAHPSLNDRFRAAPDPVALYGLPDSQVVDQGDHLAIRFQRGVLRVWKQDKPWAKAGEVTADNSGEYAVEAGMFAKESLATQQPPSVPRRPDATALVLSAPSATPATSPAVTPAPPVASAPSTSMSPPTPAPVPTVALAQVNVWQVANTDGDGAYLRKSPKLDDKLSPWGDGTLLKNLNEQATGDGVVWYKVQAPDGAVGWIPARYAKALH
jgi:hypothetical protein